MKKTILLGLGILLLTGLDAQTPVRTYLDDPGIDQHDHPLDFIRLRLELWPEPAAGKVTGKVTETFRPLRPTVDSFFLDGIKMTVTKLTLNGQAVRYRVDSAGITVVPATPLTWDTTDSLTIEYSATPRKGLYFIGWNDPRGLSRKQIWSQGEGVDNRFWIPLYDEPNDKLLTEMTVHFDSAYKVLSNGSLESVTVEPGGKKVWHYAMSHPQSAYLMMLGIGKYDIKETKSASGVPMHLYYYPDQADRVEPTYIYSEAMVDFYEKEIGVRYPWESYSQIPVQEYMFGAMENTTATIYGDFYLLDKRAVLDRKYVGVNAHELAHQWFGDYVTARSEANIWLQESFATYYDQLFEREVFGEDNFEWGRRGAGNAAIEDSKQNVRGVANSESGGNRIYGKGAFVLDMLKYVVGGREAYNKAIRSYLEKHPYSNVDTHQLLVAFEESTGMDLQWFWDEWLYRGGEPVYQVRLDEDAGGSMLVITQKPLPGGITGYKDGLFRMPFIVEAHYTDGAVARDSILIEKQTQLMRLPAGGHTLAYVLVDPGSRILKTMSFFKPFAMLAAQAVDAEHLLDRYDAVVAMRAIPLDRKREVLEKVFHRESFFAVKGEALTQLAADSGAGGVAIVLAGLADRDPAVRKAALAAIDPYSPRVTELLPALEPLLKDSSYDIVETTLQKLADARPGDRKRWLAESRGTTGALGHNVEVRWNEVAWLTSKDARSTHRLVELSSGSYEFRTRVNAMNALRRMDYFDVTLLANLADAILSPNTRLSSPATDVLNYFYGQDRWRGTIIRYVRERHLAISLPR